MRLFRPLNLEQQREILMPIVVGLIGAMVLMAILSIKDDSATNDEIAHIAAGYSYLTQQDYRLNPEHPPLAKDLAALPLLFMQLNFPLDSPMWTESVNGQWEVGQIFLYELRNDADAILLWSRSAMVLFLIALGVLLFIWSRQLLGTAAAFFVLAIFAFSPDFLAHGSLVTTDVAATLGVVLALYWFVQFLYVPSWKHAVIGGGVLAFALLLKFSTFILFPVFGLLFFLFWQFLPSSERTYKHFFSYCKKGIGMLLMATILLGVVYQFHILHYPQERQLRDSEAILSAYYQIPEEHVHYSIASIPVLRPYAQYLLGLLRSTQRIQMRTSDYFLGETEPTGWPHYFPVLYATKVPLAFHVLSFGAIVGALLVLRRKIHVVTSFRVWAHEHFSFITMTVFVAVYLIIAFVSAMHIGFRHMLPILPFVYMFAAGGVQLLIRHIRMPSRLIVIGGAAILLGWYVFSSLFTHPHYLSYYNELAGGSMEGYKIAVHGNYDWGQDTKRLSEWVEQKGIGQIYGDVYGRGDPQYYLGDRYVPWRGSSWWKLYGVKTSYPDEFPDGNYLAVSATFLVGNDWTREEAPDYEWLKDEEFVARVGRSIFIYYIE